MHIDIDIDIDLVFLKINIDFHKSHLHESKTIQITQHDHQDENITSLTGTFARTGNNSENSE